MNGYIISYGYITSCSCVDLYIIDQPNYTYNSRYMVNMALFYPHWPHLLRVVSRADERRAGLYTVPGKTRGDMGDFCARNGEIHIYIS